MCLKVTVTDDLGNVIDAMTIRAVSEHAVIADPATVDDDQLADILRKSVANVFEIGRF